MRHYETIYILNPNLAEDNYRGVIGKFNTIIEKEKGVVIKVEEWGTQRLAYTVKKLDKGAYVRVEHCGQPGSVKELERNLKLDDQVLLFQTIKLSDKVDPEELLLKEEEVRKAHELKVGETREDLSTVEEKKADEAETETPAEGTTVTGEEEVEDGLQ